MCGIASFFSNDNWRKKCDVAPFESVFNILSAETDNKTNWGNIESALDLLTREFSGLTSFSLYMEILERAEIHHLFEELSEKLRLLEEENFNEISQCGPTEILERVKERISDFLWQIENEVLANPGRVARLIPNAQKCDLRPSHLLGWGVETVLQSLEKLEVRGRDSAGISILIELDSTDSIEDCIEPYLRSELKKRLLQGDTEDSQTSVQKNAKGKSLFRVIYKCANLVGRLGENGAILRKKISDDSILWSLSKFISSINIVSHTRWASNGIINIPNCHPIDGRVIQNGQTENNADALATIFVLNGDVDNYNELVSESVASQGMQINPAISTDAKILPVLFCYSVDSSSKLSARFSSVLKKCRGSLAVVMQYQLEPKRLFVGHMGSGQAIYVGKIHDGWMISSEVYGLANLCRKCFSLNSGKEGGGASLELSADGGQEFVMTDLSGKEVIPIQEEINIFARDFFKAGYTTYIEKEINESQSSVMKTLFGKYIKENEKVKFLINKFGNCDLMVKRLVDKEKPAIKKIVVIGQGTASVAGLGIANLLREAISDSGILVESTKASELLGFNLKYNFQNMMIIAISQSGTTTDTNRIVDIAKNRGAWIHAIVNRRNSALVQKSDSYLYTSDGRDIEMAVASTKAFYSQIAAGKLFSLYVASELQTMSERDIFSEIQTLEKLPALIGQVLAKRQLIDDVATRLAPFAFSWAIVGNGFNRIAAEEIRIKMSELCYKAIPCDVTEDKKHIDLSTEPLTIVVANDLDEMVVMDTVKEVSIFKAHNGHPVVFCSEEEKRFDSVAEMVFTIPKIGAGLDFVLATVAGHLLAISAAQAIDNSCGVYKNLRAVLSEMSKDSSCFQRDRILNEIESAMEVVEKGTNDSSLPARWVAALSCYQMWLKEQPQNISMKDARIENLQNIIKSILDNLIRPIDTIRHQAKTVTVGISRPQEIHTMP